MKSINDSAFGEMQYKVSWKKEDTLKLWGHSFKIFITASDLDEEGINTTQQEMYLAVKDKMANIIDDNFNAIIDFCAENFELQEVIPPEISSHLQPTNILFQRDGSWGILLDCDYDPEHGIALYFENGSAKVGTQGMFL